MCISISNILQKDMRTTRKPHSEHKGQSIEEVCTAFNRVYSSILEAVKYIQPTTDTEGDYFPVVPHVARAFQAFLGRLHKFALDEFARREQEDKRNKRAAARRSEDTPTAHHTPISDENLAKARRLLRTMARMMTTLDVSVGAHCELLEGYLCAILDHLGSSLSLLTFANATGSRQKQAGLLPPIGLLDIAQLNVESAIGAAAIEGPYVLFVLRKGVQFLLENAKRMPTKSLSIFTVQQPADNNGLRGQIQETLQNTLLRGAFGDEDDTFFNSLRRDEEEEETVDLNKTITVIKEKETSAEWFIGELWEYLGWDILSGQTHV
jgi:hypothetical protein